MSGRCVRRCTAGRYWSVRQVCTVRYCTAGLYGRRSSTLPYGTVLDRSHRRGSGTVTLVYDSVNLILPYVKGTRRACLTVYLIYVSLRLPVGHTLRYTSYIGTLRAYLTVYLIYRVPVGYPYGRPRIGHAWSSSSDTDQAFDRFATVWPKQYRYTTGCTPAVHCCTAKQSVQF